MKETMTAAILIFVFVSLFEACDLPKQPPLRIEADGHTDYACRGWIWINNEGGLIGEKAFGVTYTDAQGLAHTLRGVRKLATDQLPESVLSEVPQFAPDPKTGFDRDGKPFREGQLYTDSRGNKLQIVAGQWQARLRPNPLCAPSQTDADYVAPNISRVH